MKGRPVRTGILERIAAGVVLADGGYLLELEHRGYVQAGAYTPEVVLECPDAIRQLHVEFKRAGAEVLQALTFYGSRDKLASGGRLVAAEEVNRAAVRIAREAAGDDTLVAGGLTQTPAFCAGPVARSRASDLMTEQVAWQQDEGIDFVVGETFCTLAEALLALAVIRRSGLPAMITMSIGPFDSVDGFSVPECARRLAGEGADIVGLNCSFDPDTLLPAVERMRDATDTYIACQPIGYRTPDPLVAFTDHPDFPLALEPWQLTRFHFADFARRAADAGVNYLGGCCGVGAYHVRSMAEALDRRPAASEKSPDLSAHVIPAVARRASGECWEHVITNWRQHEPSSPLP